MPDKEWPLCQVCGKPVDTSEGFLLIYGNELKEYEDNNNEWRERHPQQVYDEADLLEMPRLVNWHWGHSKCLKDGMYEIPYSRFDTVTKALSWTLHLMEKNWLAFTRWGVAVRAHHEIPDA